MMHANAYSGAAGAAGAGNDQGGIDLIARVNFIVIIGDVITVVAVVVLHTVMIN